MQTIGITIPPVVDIHTPDAIKTKMNFAKHGETNKITQLEGT